jgi:uncharacterized ion transporter superfamily protein YfcC
LTTCFLLFGILRRLSEKNLVDTFVDGAQDMRGVALIIGVARGISVFMNNSLTNDPYARNLLALTGI